MKRKRFLWLNIEKFSTFPSPPLTEIPCCTQRQLFTKFFCTRFFCQIFGFSPLFFPGIYVPNFGQIVGCSKIFFLRNLFPRSRFKISECFSSFSDFYFACKFCQNRVFVSAIFVKRRCVQRKKALRCVACAQSIFSHILQNHLLYEVFIF